MEFFILGALNWRLNFLTASDVLRLLASITELKGNTEIFLKYSDNFSALCYSDYSLSKLGSVVIALSSACCVF